MYSPIPMPVAVPAASQTTGRYAYLVGRLRSRQITMEEATELFALQQTMIARASVMNNPPPPPPAAPQDSTVATPPPRNVPAGGGGLPVNDETITLALLGMGVGAGLLAAVLKRARDGPKPPG
ncbi:MAG: hypothetical protein L3K00_00495 [Thermoplasmata archaeon]|nr:hypothetical protein [Thermoplasmata archaeon]MCI4362534.1 hypothetical protein [Thermoplasmata archaeon]